MSRCPLFKGAMEWAVVELLGLYLWSVALCLFFWEWEWLWLDLVPNRSLPEEECSGAALSLSLSTSSSALWPGIPVHSAHTHMLKYTTTASWKTGSEAGFLWQSSFMWSLPGVWLLLLTFFIVPAAGASNHVYVKLVLWICNSSTCKGMMTCLLGFPRLWNTCKYQGVWKLCF